MPFRKKRSQNTIFGPLLENEKEREQGSNLRRQRLANPNATAQVLVAQTTGRFKRIGVVTSFFENIRQKREIGQRRFALSGASSVCDFRRLKKPLRGRNVSDQFLVFV